MNDDEPNQLTRRERQIMDVVYRLGRATVAEVVRALPDPPSYSAVRALMRLMEDKGYLRHEQHGPRYVYRSTTSAESARRSAVRRLLRTFFNGSAEHAVAALLRLSEADLTEAELDRLAELIEEHRIKAR